MKTIAIIASILAVIVVSIVWYEYKYPCIRGHYEEVYHPGSYIMCSKVLVPTAAYTSKDFICDCREGIDTLKNK